MSEAVYVCYIMRCTMGAATGYLSLAESIVDSGLNLRVFIFCKVIASASVTPNE